MPGVDLTAKQLELRQIIERNLKILKDDIHLGTKLTWPEKQEAFSEMSKAAHELHMSLDPRPKHHRYMIENRGLSPEDPEFYYHIHPTEDLLDYLNDIHANDDPEDQTIGHMFKFRVYSKRWGHKDAYHLTRNENGWVCQFNAYNDQGDKNAEPILYTILEHDSISYPRDLPEFMNWLWTQAYEQGLTHDEVQKALDDLAEWISLCEKNAPTGTFRGLK